MRFFRIPAVALALVIGVVAGCEEIGSPGAPEIQAGPSFDLSADSTVTTDTSTLQLVELNWADSATYVVEGWINKNGGKLDLGDHALVVSRGAVPHRTKFVFTAVLGKYLIMDLKAFDQAGNPVTTFNADVYLSLNYEKLEWMGDPKRLTVAYLADGTTTGRKEKVESQVSQKDKKVVGRMRHFSIYSMAID